MESKVESKRCGAERNFQQCKVLISQLNFALVCLQKIRRASMTLPGRGKKPTSRSAEGRAAEDEKEEDPLVISKLGDMAHVKRVFDETIVGVRARSSLTRAPCFLLAPLSPSSPSTSRPPVSPLARPPASPSSSRSPPSPGGVGHGLRRAARGDARQDLPRSRHDRLRSVRSVLPMQPFPESLGVLAVCVAGYGLFNALLQAFVTFVECGAILFTKPKHGAGRAAAKGTRRANQSAGFQEVYTMTVHAGKGAKAHECAEAAVSVCDYVYEDGVVDEDKIRELAEDVVRRFERGEFGRVGEGDNKRRVIETQCCKPCAPKF